MNTVESQRITFNSRNPAGGLVLIQTPNFPEPRFAIKAELQSGIEPEVDGQKLSAMWQPTGESKEVFVLLDTMQVDDSKVIEMP